MAAGAEVVRSVFGVPLQGQGRGFYVALELFAILRGSLLLDTQEESSRRLLPPKGEKLEFLRPAHDFARRVMADDFTVSESRHLREHVSESSVDALRSLLRGVQAPVPGRRSDPPDWRRWHLYPFPSEFVHYDALRRRGKVSIERNYYRGGGGLAHKILREDEDVQRLSSIREGFRELLSDSESPLGSLASALSELDVSKAQADEPFEDEMERDSRVLGSPWVEELREGTLRILLRDLADSKKIETLMHWVPFCIMRHQLTLAYTAAQGTSSDSLQPITADCQPANNPIRDRARRDFTDAGAAIRTALEKHAAESNPALLEGSKSWIGNARTFFTTTAYAVGAANAPSGIRWFTLRPALLESIVFAKVPKAKTFESFCANVLCDDLGLVVGRHGAETYAIDDIDRSEFQANSEALAEVLEELGLLERYSDMTRMVGGSS